MVDPYSHQFTVACGMFTSTIRDADLDANGDAVSKWRIIQRGLGCLVSPSGGYDFGSASLGSDHWQFREHSLKEF
jgi:hypothetical protein